MQGISQLKQKDAWFNEKYNPEVLEMLEKEKRDTFKKNYTQFITRLEEGYYNAIDLRVIDTVKVQLYRTKLGLFVN